MFKGKTRHHSRGLISVNVGAFLSTLEDRNYSEKSLTSFRQSLEPFLLFLAAKGIARLQDVTPAELAAYRVHLAEERSLRISTIHQYLRTVRRFFAYLEETRVVFLNPAAALEMPRPDRRLGFVPTRVQVKRLLSQPDTATNAGVRDRALMETAYSTGIRAGELCALRLHDLQLRERLIRVMGKGRKERLVPLGRTAATWLKRYLKEHRGGLLLKKKEDALWLSVQGGRPLQVMGLELQMRRYSARAALERNITPHALRRACATHMLQNGAHPVEVQLLLGHASLRTLSQYLGLTITDLKAAHKNSKPGQ